jgi:hypothetical protein
MNYLLFILFAWLLSLILGTSAGILITLYKNDNVKVKVITVIILLPFIYTLILGLGFKYVFENNLLLLIAFFIAGIAKSTIFGPQKYLLKLEIKPDGTISITYLNSLLKAKHLECLLDDDKHLDLSEMKSLVHLPPSLTLTSNDNKNRFIIISKNIWTSVNQTLSAANIGFAARGADGRKFSN